jgi:DNA-binding transcriptional LysR family regulator
MLRQLTRLGLGIACLDELLVVADLEEGSLVRVLEEWRAPPTPVCAVTASKTLPRKTRLLIECLREHLDLVRKRARAAGA